MRLTMVIVPLFIFSPLWHGSTLRSSILFCDFYIYEYTSIFYFEIYFCSMSDYYGLQLSLAKDLSSIIGLAGTPQNEYARNLI